MLAASMKILHDAPLFVHYGQFYVAPPGSGGVDLIDAFSGQANGLCGAAVSQHLFLITGLHSGHVPVRVTLHNEAPGEDDPAWEEIVEAPFDVVQTPLALEGWGGSVRYELAIPPGRYRVRYKCRAMDQGHEMDTIAEDGDVAPDTYELAFWPEQPSADTVLKQTSETAAYWHGTVERV